MQSNNKHKGIHPHEKVLLKVVQSHLWNVPAVVKELSAAQFSVLFREAQKQTVSGFLCNELIERKVKLQSGDAMQTLVALNSIKRTNLRVNDTLKSLTQILNKHNVKFVVVKGQTLAALYPNPQLRLPGDIDLYCDEHNFQRAIEAVKKEWDIDAAADEANSDDSEQHVMFYRNEVLMELHFCLYKFASRKYQRISMQ